MIEYGWILIIAAAGYIVGWIIGYLEGYKRGLAKAIQIVKET